MFRKRKEGRGERRGGALNERAASLTHPDWDSKLKLRYAPRLGIKPKMFSCTGTTFQVSEPPSQGMSC